MDLGGGITHIGIVVNKKSADQQRWMIVHNIGGGQELADCLFKDIITGHYRYEKEDFKKYDRLHAFYCGPIW